MTVVDLVDVDGDTQFDCLFGSPIGADARGLAPRVLIWLRDAHPLVNDNHSASMIRAVYETADTLERSTFVDSVPRSLGDARPDDWTEIVSDYRLILWIYPQQTTRPAAPWRQQLLDGNWTGLCWVSAEHDDSVHTFAPSWLFINRELEPDIDIGITPANRGRGNQFAPRNVGVGEIVDFLTETQPTLAYNWTSLVSFRGSGRGLYSLQDFPFLRIMGVSHPDATKPVWWIVAGDTDITDIQRVRVNTPFMKQVFEFVRPDNYLGVAGV